MKTVRSVLGRIPYMRRQSGHTLQSFDWQTDLLSPLM
jgi:hypothetical protein